MSSLSNFFSHMLLPGYSNNQKAKLLHTESVVFLALILIFGQLVVKFIPLAGLKILGFASQIAPDEVVRLTNEKRAAFGVGQLTYNSALAAAARKKGEDMLNRDYWAHVAPDGTSPWRFFNEAGYKYKYAGENLAKDFSSPQSAVEAWMASPSHKENLLSSKYDEIGIAVVEGDLNGSDTTIIVQLFGKRYDQNVASVTTSSNDNKAVEKSTENGNTPTGIPNPTAAPTLAPTDIPTVVPTPTITTVISQGGNTPTPFQVLISPFTTKKGVSVATTLVLLSAFVVDGVYLTKRKVVRVGGSTFTHIIFLTMILAVVVIIQSGEMLPPIADVLK